MQPRSWTRRKSACGSAVHSSPSGPPRCSRAVFKAAALWSSPCCLVADRLPRPASHASRSAILTVVLTAYPSTTSKITSAIHSPTLGLTLWVPIMSTRIPATPLDLPLHAPRPAMAPRPLASNHTADLQLCPFSLQICRHCVLSLASVYLCQHNLCLRTELAGFLANPYLSHR